MEPKFTVIRSDLGDGGWSIHDADAPATSPPILSGEAEWDDDDGGWDRPNEADLAHAAVVLLHSKQYGEIDHIVTGTIDQAVSAWSVAAGHAGAFAPGHIAAELLLAEGLTDAASFLAAIVRGCEAAYEENGGFSPPPRGVEVEIRGGRFPVLDWRSENHSFQITRIDAGDEDLYRRGHWQLRCQGPLNSPRILAAAQEWADQRESSSVPGWDGRSFLLRRGGAK